MTYIRSTVGGSATNFVAPRERSIKFGGAEWERSRRSHASRRGVRTRNQREQEASEKALMETLSLNGEKGARKHPVNQHLLKIREMGEQRRQDPQSPVRTDNRNTQLQDSLPERPLPKYRRIRHARYRR